MIKAIFFDLDGTLLPMDEGKFEKIYFGSLCQHLVPYGYNPQQVLTSILTGVEAMMRNESGLSNEDIFWLTFNKCIGRDCTGDKPIFEEYYKTKFSQTKDACGYTTFSKEIVDFCRKNFDILVLSTNPLFPSIATETRMGYVGLKPSDLDFVTTYENFGYCKPNPKYFIELMKKFNLKPEEVLVIGNNTLEDCECALACGIKSILIKGNIIYDKKSTHSFKEFEFNEIIPFLKTLK